MTQYHYHAQNNSNNPLNTKYDYHDNIAFDITSNNDDNDTLLDSFDLFMLDNPTIGNQYCQKTGQMINTLSQSQIWQVWQSLDGDANRTLLALQSFATNNVLPQWIYSDIDALTNHRDKQSSHFCIFALARIFYPKEQAQTQSQDSTHDSIITQRYHTIIDKHNALSYLLALPQAQSQDDNDCQTTIANILTGTPALAKYDTNHLAEMLRIALAILNPKIKAFWTLTQKHNTIIDLLTNNSIDTIVRILQNDIIALIRHYQKDKLIKTHLTAFDIIALNFAYQGQKDMAKIPMKPRNDLQMRIRKEKRHYASILDDFANNLNELLPFDFATLDDISQDSEQDDLITPVLPKQANNYRLAPAPVSFEKRQEQNETRYRKGLINARAYEAKKHSLTQQASLSQQFANIPKAAYAPRPILVEMPKAHITVSGLPSFLRKSPTQNK